MIILTSLAVLFSISILQMSYSEEDVDLLYQKGLESHLDGKLDDALYYYDKVLVIEPNHLKALNNKGGILSDFGKHEEAISYYDKILEIEPNNVDALNNKGSLLSTLGEFDDAIPYLDRALEIDPNHVDALNNRGAVFVEQNNFDDALTNFDKALTIDPENELAKIYLELAKDALGFKRVDGFSEFILRDDKGNLITYYKSPYIRLLNHKLAEDFVDKMPVMQEISFNNTNYEVRQLLFKNVMQEEKVFAMVAVHYDANPELRIFFSSNWGVPIKNGDIVYSLYTIFTPVE